MGSQSHTEVTFVYIGSGTLVLREATSQLFLRHVLDGLSIGAVFWPCTYSALSRYRDFLKCQILALTRHKSQPLWRWAAWQTLTPLGNASWLALSQWCWPFDRRGQSSNVTEASKFRRQAGVVLLTLFHGYDSRFTELARSEKRDAKTDAFWNGNWYIKWKYTNTKLHDMKTN